MGKILFLILILSSSLSYSSSSSEQNFKNQALVIQSLVFSHSLNLRLHEQNLSNEELVILVCENLYKDSFESHVQELKSMSLTNRRFLKGTKKIEGIKLRMKINSLARKSKKLSKVCRLNEEQSPRFDEKKQSLVNILSNLRTQSQKILEIILQAHQDQ